MSETNVHVCLWCDTKVAEEGDTCNLGCYTRVTQAISLATFIEHNDTPPKDLWLQPWSAAILNTQEGR